MFSFLFVLEIGLFLSLSLFFFLFVSPLGGGEAAEAGLLAFVEFSAGITALSLCLCRSHTHTCSTRAATRLPLYAAQERSTVDLAYQEISPSGAGLPRRLQRQASVMSSVFGLNCRVNCTAAQLFVC